MVPFPLLFLWNFGKLLKMFCVSFGVVLLQADALTGYVHPVSPHVLSLSLMVSSSRQIN